MSDATANRGHASMPAHHLDVEYDRQLQNGEKLARSGQLDHAEMAFKQALACRPDDPVATSYLARVLLGLNRSGEALTLLDGVLRSAAGSQHPDLLLLRAQTLLGANALADAIPAFQTAIDAAPTSGVAELGLAMALGETGQITAAQAAARNAIAKGADSPGARYVLGRALLEDNQHEEAEAEFRLLLQQQPTHTAAHQSLSDLIWMRSGDTHAASRELDAALATNPALTGLRIMKARLLEAAGKPQEALSTLEAGLTQPEGLQALQLAASQIAIHLDPLRALSHAEDALRAAPGHPQVIGAYADALLANGRAQEVAEIGSKLHAFDPNDGHAIALLASAWRMLGDPRHHALSNYNELVRTSVIDTPAGWPNLAAYLEDLAIALHRMHRWQEHPVDQTLRSGTQVAIHPEYATDRAVRALPDAIASPINRYLAALGQGDDLMRRRNTGRYRLSGLWSVRLRPNGHHLNHFHGKGWLSSACYIELPGAMGDSGGEGWLKFGEPAMPTSPALPPEWFIRPEPGLLALFPSWMWHGTVPFSGQPQDRRLTVAFDIVPA